MFKRKLRANEQLPPSTEELDIVAKQVTPKLRRAKYIGLATTIALTATALIPPAHAYWQDQRSVRLSGKAGSVSAYESVCSNVNPYRVTSIVDTNWVGPLIRMPSSEGQSDPETYVVHITLYARGTVVALQDLVWRKFGPIEREYSAQDLVDQSGMYVPDRGKHFSVRIGLNSVMYKPKGDEVYLDLYSMFMGLPSDQRPSLGQNWIGAGAVIQVLPKHGNENTWEAKPQALPAEVRRSYTSGDAVSAPRLPVNLIEASFPPDSPKPVIVHNSFSLHEGDDSATCAQ